MLTREELGRELEDLEARMPALKGDMNAFFEAFEHEAGRLLGQAEEADCTWLEDQLLGIVQRHGITPANLAP